MAQSPNENICPLEESNQTGAGTKGSISSCFGGKTIIRQLVGKLKRSKRCPDFQHLEQLAGSDQQYIGQISRPIPHLKQAITSVPSNDLPSQSDQQYIDQISRPIPHLKQAITSVPSNDLPSQSDQQYIGQISRPIPHLKQAITSVPSNGLPSHFFRSESRRDLVNTWLYCMGQAGEKIFE